MPDGDGETPDAQAMLGDAQVIEGGGTDASSTTVEDNHVEVTVVTPPAPEPEPEPVAAESAEEQRQEDAAVADLRGRVDGMDARLATIEQGMSVLLAAASPEEPEEPAAPPATIEEDRPPKRTMWLHRKPFSRKDNDE